MLNEKEVMELLSKYGIKAEAMNVTKNNNIILRGIVVGEGNVRPTLYLQNYDDPQALLRDAIRFKNDIPEFQELDRLTDWDYVKDKFRIKLLRNPESHLVTYPAFCDLVQTVYIKLTDEATIGVKKDLFDSYGVALDQFFRLALKNTEEYEGAELVNLIDMIKSFSLEPVNYFDDFMHVLTNTTRTYGASAILYHKDLPDKFYMLPSSVHETILIYPVNYFKDLYSTDLSKVVRDVNTTNLDPVDVLSDHAYYYEDGKWSSLE